MTRTNCVNKKGIKKVDDKLKMQSSIINCAWCNKKLNGRNWYKVSKKYFCCLQHLQNWEDKNMKAK